VGARSRALIAACLTVVALGGAATTATTAYAGSDDFCYGWQDLYLVGRDCSGPDHSLRQVRSYAITHQYVVGAYATYPGTATWYGSPVYAINYVCHSYAGNNILTPWNANPDPANGAKFGGRSFWGSEPACP
jgi:hypothetical protein